MSPACYFTLVIICSLVVAVVSQASIITLLNSTNVFCEQDIVQFNCSLGSGPSYDVLQAGLSFNESTVCNTPTQINDNLVVGIDTTRIHFTATVLSAISPPGLYTISPFLIPDDLTSYRCCASVVSSPTQFTNSIILLLAAPPVATINISTTYVPSASCTGTITLTWPAVTSDREVTSFEVLLNGTNVSTTTPTAGTNTYTTSIMSLADFTGTYTVRAISCAGSSVSNDLVFTPPFAPNKPQISVYNYSSDCKVNVSISWDPVSSPREVTHYDVLFGNNLTPAITTLTFHSVLIDLTSYTQLPLTITVRAVSCAGFNTSNSFPLVLTRNTTCIGPSGLSTPAIVGIVVGILFFLLVVLLLIIFSILIILYLTNKRNQQE